MKELNSDIIRMVYNNHFKDFLVYTLVITGIGLGDAFEAGRINTKVNNFFSIATWFLFAALLIILLLLSINFGHQLEIIMSGRNASIDESLPLDYLLWAIFVSFVAKITLEVIKTRSR